jgi:hypothetical protein
MSGGNPLLGIGYAVFPLLAPSNHHKTSEQDSGYNCIAWAAGRDDRIWWPDADGFGYWPISEREETIPCFVEAYKSIGYEECERPELEPGFEKIAIYAKPNNGEPTHAARQKPNGRWTSKMGIYAEDIEHDWGVLEGPCYGEVVCIMRRPIKQETPAPPCPLHFSPH